MPVAGFMKLNPLEAVDVLGAAPKPGKPVLVVVAGAPKLNDGVAAVGAAEVPNAPPIVGCCCCCGCC